MYYTLGRKYRSYKHGIVFVITSFNTGPLNSEFPVLSQISAPVRTLKSSFSRVWKFEKCFGFLPDFSINTIFFLGSLFVLV